MSEGAVASPGWRPGGRGGVRSERRTCGDDPGRQRRASPRPPLIRALVLLLLLGLLLGLLLCRLHLLLLLLRRLRLPREPLCRRVQQARVLRAEHAGRPACRARVHARQLRRGCGHRDALRLLGRR
jgi:hypothetical protein